MAQPQRAREKPGLRRENRALAGEMLKRCSDCGIVKGFQQFNLAKGKPRATCRACQSKAYKAYATANPGQYKALKRASKYRSRFNLSIDEVERIFATARYACEACGTRKDELALGIRLVLDHDHSCCPTEFTCGKCIRGVLCTSCNMALGAVRDDPDRLTAIVDYMHRSVDGKR
jgi:hypothetical protein